MLTKEIFGNSIPVISILPSHLNYHILCRILRMEVRGSMTAAWIHSKKYCYYRKFELGF